LEKLLALVAGGPLSPCLLSSFYKSSRDSLMGFLSSFSLSCL
jgi:hypothetical protein